MAGTVQDVLVQAFERCVLTYTPTNPAGFQVEMDNVGRHYHAWRYQGAGAPPPTTSAACALLLQLSDLPAGYRVQGEQCPQNQPIGMRLIAVASRRGTAVGIVAGLALPNAGDQGQVVEWAKIMDGRIASRPG